MLSYVLELVEASNIKDITVVVSGDDAALCIGNWVTEAFHDCLCIEVGAKKIQVSRGLFSVDLLEHLASHGARGLSYLILFSFFMTIIFVGFRVLCISLRTGNLGVRIWTHLKH